MCSGKQGFKLLKHNFSVPAQTSRQETTPNGQKQYRKFDISYQIFWLLREMCKLAIDQMSAFQELLHHPLTKM